MKKNIIILLICCSTSTAITPQAISQSYSVVNSKKNYKCLVRIETRAEEKIEGALELFAADSVYIAPVEDKYVQAGGEHIKILSDTVVRAIAVAQICKFEIKYDPNIVYPDDVSKRKKQLRRKNGGRIAGMVFSGIFTAPLILGGGTPVIVDGKNFSGSRKKKTSFSAGKLFVSKIYQTFEIHGDRKTYAMMVQRLTESNAKPFK